MWIGVWPPSNQDGIAATGAGLLALGATARGLALARGVAAADTHALLVRAGSGREIVQLHRFVSDAAVPAADSSGSTSTVTR